MIGLGGVQDLIDLVLGEAGAVEEATFPGVFGEDGLLDRVGPLEAVQGFECEGAPPVVLPAVDIEYR